MQTSPTTASRRMLVAGATALALVVTGLVAAQPASAAYSVAFSPTGGKVGSAIALNSSVSSGALGVAAGKVVYFADGAQVATAAVNTTGAVAAASWTPTKAGAVQMYAVYTSTDNSQTATSGTKSVTINKVSTSTTLDSPSVAKVGTSVSFTATVSTGNAYGPTGSVTFQKADGTPLQTVNLGGQGKASVNVIMPATAQTYSIKVRYNGDSNAQASMSETNQVLVTLTGSNVTLTAPTALTVGKQVTLKASIAPSSATGSVTFLLNGAILGAQKISGGSASIQWTPLAVGTFTLTANYSETGIAVDGTASQQVTVSAQQTPDTVTLVPAGEAQAWIPGAGYPVRNGTTLAFTATTASGAAAVLSVTGPCSVSGLSVSANAGSGACLLTAKSPGAGAFSAVSQSYTMTLILGVPTASLAAPVTRSVLRVGGSYLLSASGTATNAGSPVSWRVTKGKSRCSVVVSSAGTSLLAKRYGKCRVSASAPGVAGQWRVFTKKFRYRVR